MIPPTKIAGSFKVGNMFPKHKAPPVILKNDDDACDSNHADLGAPWREGGCEPIQVEGRVDETKREEDCCEGGGRRIKGGGGGIADTTMKRQKIGGEKRGEKKRE